MVKDLSSYVQKLTSYCEWSTCVCYKKYYFSCILVGCHYLACVCVCVCVCVRACVCMCVFVCYIKSVLWLNDCISVKFRFIICSVVASFFHPKMEVHQKLGELLHVHLFSCTHKYMQSSVSCYSESYTMTSGCAVVWSYCMHATVQAGSWISFFFIIF